MQTGHFTVGGSILWGLWVPSPEPRFKSSMIDVAGSCAVPRPGAVSPWTGRAPSQVCASLGKPQGIAQGSGST